MADTSAQLVALSQWIDRGNEGKDPEAILWGRVAKITEEAGEAIAALIGWTGQNPRKGYTHSGAITALGAVEHVTGHQGDALDRLDDKIARVAARAMGTEASNA